MTGLGLFSWSTQARTFFPSFSFSFLFLFHLLTFPCSLCEMHQALFHTVCTWHLSDLYKCNDFPLFFSKDFFFFDVDQFSKSLYWIYYNKYCFGFMFCFVLFWPQGMWDLSSPTRNWTCTPCIWRWSLNHWASSGIPTSLFLMRVCVHTQSCLTLQPPEL